MAIGPWTAHEIDVAINAYFRMFRRELRGQHFVKADFRREVEAQISRSSKAVEYKFANISACLEELGFPWISGYAPMRNVQNALRTRVRDYVGQDQEFQDLVN